MKGELPIRMWRISRATPFGLYVWFDPSKEVVVLRDLTEGEKAVILDKVSSVSALPQSDDSEDNLRKPSGLVKVDQILLPLIGEDF